MSIEQDGDRYQLVSRIATGGMGEVWRAEDTVLEREVAVKILKREYADDPTFHRRFRAEARHAAGLNHPNIASVFDVGELDEEDGSGVHRPFLVMELVPGEPLSELLRDGRPMPPERAADIVAQVADGLAAAHAMGIVHRDVKPANLLVAEDGTVKVTDFGIARAADGAAVTQTGQIIGTPHYISPEQAEGASATPASDIYALGVVLYECLAGQRPFRRDTPIQVALAHVREPVPALGEDVPAWLRAVVDRTLAKRPDDRYASGGELAVALRDGAAAGAAAVADASPDSTRVLPAVAPGPAPEHPADRPEDAAGAAGIAGAARATDDARLPRWWPWAAATAVVLALVVATAAFAGGGDTAPAAADTSAAPETSPAAGSDATSKRPDQRVRVREGDYLGRDHKEVKDELEGLGLEVSEEKLAATSPEQRKGTVASVTPHGKLPPGTTVTLGVYEKYEPPKDSAPRGGPAESDDSDDEDAWEDKHGDKPGKGKGRGKGDD